MGDPAGKGSDDVEAPAGARTNRVDEVSDHGDSSDRILREEATGDPTMEESAGTAVGSVGTPAGSLAAAEGGSRSCACGCAQPVSGDAAFIVGHAERALDERIARRWGSAVAFIEWFDSTEEDTDG